MKRMNIQEIRRRNARALQASAGGQAEFVRVTGLDQSYVSRIIGPNPDRNIGEKLRRRIETAFSKPDGWLDKIHSDAVAPPSKSDNNVVELRHPNVEPGPDITGSVPLISWVAAGNWAEIVDNFAPGDAEDWLSCPVSHGPLTYCLRIKGASMEPRFHDGEIIFVDPDAQPENGSFIVVRLEDRAEATFKKLRIEGGQMWLEALNPAWPERFLPVTEHATICGVAIFKGEAL